jgi:hypothetical protein
MGYAMGQDASLARTGAGEDEKRAESVVDGLELLRVEGLRR